MQNLFCRNGLFLLGLLLAGRALAIVEKNDLHTGQTFSIQIENIVLDSYKVNIGFVKARLTGIDEVAGILHVVGDPELPVVRLFIDGDGEISVSSDDSVEFLSLPEGNQIYPAQESVPKIKGSGRIFSKNEAAYNLDWFFPDRFYEIKKIGTIKGIQRRMVTIYPLKYNPKRSLLSLRKNLVVHQKFLEAKPSPQDSVEPDLMVFVVGKKYAQSDALRKYMEYKRRLGYEMASFTVEEDQTPDDIRAKLMDFYHDYGKRFKYAQIIGDNEDVPGMKTDENFFGLSDHYYRCLDQADYKKDIGTPDIGLGRTSVANEKELKVVFDKYMYYEKGQFQDKTWLNKIGFIATDDEEFWQLAEGTHNYVVDSYTKESGYVGQFPEPNLLGGDKLYPVTFHAIKENAMDVFNNGRLIINYSGHGNDTAWASPGLIKIADIANVLSPAARPFVVSNACLTGNFTAPISLSEAWQRSPTGAIAFWGSTETTFWDEDDVLERKMWEGIFLKGKRTFSDITINAQQEFWRYYGGVERSEYYFEVYTLFGDPSIKLLLKNKS